MDQITTKAASRTAQARANFAVLVHDGCDRSDGNPPLPKGPFETLTGQIGPARTRSFFAKNEQIFGEGGSADHVYQVVAGAVRSFKLLADGRCQIIAFYLPRDVFGVEPGAVYRTTSEAIVDTDVRALDRRSLDHSAAVNPAIRQELWNVTADNLRHAEDHLLLLGRKTAPERVAAFLLEMDRRTGGEGRFPLPMPRRDIGDYLGLTIETVSRVLSELHDHHILDFAGARGIVLRDRERLIDVDCKSEAV